MRNLSGFFAMTFKVNEKDNKIMLELCSEFKLKDTTTISLSSNCFVVIVDYVDICMSCLIWDQPFSTYAKFPEELTFLPCWHAHVHVYQGARNVSVWENYAYVLNEGFLFCQLTVL